MIEDADKAFSKRMQSVYPDDWNNFVIIDKFPVPDFPSVESNTLPDSHVVFYK